MSDPEYFDLGEDFRAAADFVGQLQGMRAAAYDQLTMLTLDRPDYRSFLMRRATELTTEILGRYVADATLPAAQPTFTEAFMKWVFAFTSPNDHADTLSTGLLERTVADGWQRLRAYDGDEGATLQGLAEVVDTAASMMLFTKLGADQRGELDGLPADEQFLAVWDMVDQIIQRAPGGAGPSDGPSPEV